jgi:hypothetical protein
MKEIQQMKEMKSKIGYIERVKEERDKKMVTDTKVKDLEDKEKDLLEKISRSQHLLRIMKVNKNGDN